MQLFKYFQLIFVQKFTPVSQKQKINIYRIAFSKQGEWNVKPKKNMGFFCIFVFISIKIPFTFQLKNWMQCNKRKTKCNKRSLLFISKMRESKKVDVCFVILSHIRAICCVVAAIFIMCFKCNTWHFPVENEMKRTLSFERRKFDFGEMSKKKNNSLFCTNRRWPKEEWVELYEEFGDCNQM